MVGLFDLGIRVLVVDDMKTMRRIVSKALNSIGFSDLIDASDGALAWEALQNSEKEVGLVVSDWNMPNCTGLDFLKRVRTDSKYGNVPFLLLTGESDAEHVKLAVLAGVDNYVIKPFSAETLRKKLEETYKKRSNKDTNI